MSIKRRHLLSILSIIHYSLIVIFNPGLVMWDFVMDKSGAGAGFLRELQFPLPIYIPSASPQSFSLSPEAATIG
jgi:hypothetical protein